MNKKPDMRKVFWCTAIISFAVNIVGIIIFIDKVILSPATLVGGCIFIALLIHGVCVYSKKDDMLFFASKGHSGRFYRYNRPTQEQLKDFYIKATVYFAILPFYLPIAAFSSDVVHTLWGLLLLFIHIFAIFSIDIRKMILWRKEAKRVEAIMQKEKEEQERREELGYWK